MQLYILFALLLVFLLVVCKLFIKINKLNTLLALVVIMILVYCSLLLTTKERFSGNRPDLLELDLVLDLGIPRRVIYTDKYSTFYDTSNWSYGSHGGFVNALIRRAKEKNKISADADLTVNEETFERCVSYDKDCNNKITKLKLDLDENNRFSGCYAPVPPATAEFYYIKSIDPVENRERYWEKYAGDCIQNELNNNASGHTLKNIVDLCLTDDTALAEVLSKEIINRYLYKFPWTIQTDSIKTIYKFKDTTPPVTIDIVFEPVSLHTTTAAPTTQIPIAAPTTSSIPAPPTSTPMTTAALALTSAAATPATTPAATAAATPATTPAATTAAPTTVATTTQAPTIPSIISGLKLIVDNDEKTIILKNNSGKSIVIKKLSFNVEPDMNPSNLRSFIPIHGGGHQSTMVMGSLTKQGEEVVINDGETLNIIDFKNEYGIGNNFSTNRESINITNISNIRLENNAGPIRADVSVDGLVSTTTQQPDPTTRAPTTRAPTTRTPTTQAPTAPQPTIMWNSLLNTYCDSCIENSDVCDGPFSDVDLEGCKAKCNDDDNCEGIMYGEYSDSNECRKIKNREECPSTNLLHSDNENIYWKPPPPAPTTRAPTTRAPTTRAPTTRAPTTQAPTTRAPTTQAPTTRAPTTQAPTTAAPTTQAPTTTPRQTTATYLSTTQASGLVGASSGGGVAGGAASVNPSLTTQAPTTAAPTTQAPTTQAPTTQAPTTTPRQTTAAPTTQVPTTQAPTTQAPTTTVGDEWTEIPKKTIYYNCKYHYEGANKTLEGCKALCTDYDNCEGVTWQPGCDSYLCNRCYIHTGGECNFSDLGVNTSIFNTYYKPT